MSVQRPDATAEHTGTRVSADREHAIVLRQALFREVNERIEGLGELFELVETDRLDVLCECGNAGCTERVELTQGEYEEIRRHPTHFVVKPGHTSADVERVAETTNGYAVVEKFGESSLAAIRLDPRRSSGASLS